MERQRGGFAKGGGEGLFLLLMVGGEGSLGRGYSRPEYMLALRNG